MFKDEADDRTCLGLLEREKQNHPFSLSASVLMTNHVHRRLERQRDPLSRIRPRRLTGSAQSGNRNYRTVGPVFLGRDKALLCQKDAYLKLVHKSAAERRLNIAPT
jgi:hypothetical protein